MPPEIVGALTLACRAINRCAALLTAPRSHRTQRLRHRLRSKVQKQLERAMRFQAHRDGVL